jgi:hypothetical protein
MREQAKKMNVQSLRSGDNQNMSTEIKLAKVRRRNILKLHLDIREKKSRLIIGQLLNEFVNYRLL